MEEVFTRYFHFLGILFLSSSLVLLHMSAKIEMKKNELRRVNFYNYFYLFSILVVAISGVLLWFFVGKPAEFYSHNWIFHLKITLILSLVFLSLLFTYYLNKAKTTSDIVLEKLAIKLINIELIFLLFIPLCAVFMAHGYGYYSVVQQ